MRYAELLELAPGLREFTARIPGELDGRFQLKTYPATPSSTRRTAPWSRSASCCKGPSGW